MTWRAILDPCGVRMPLRGAFSPARGTLWIEVPLREGQGERILARHQDGESVFRIRLGASGIVSLLHGTADAVRHIELPPLARDGARTVLVSYAWDQSLDWARLSAETDRSVTARVAISADPLPLCADQLHAVFAHIVASSEPGSFAALSDEVEPIGPNPTIFPETPVKTSLGLRPVRQIGRGDVVADSSTDLHPVLQVLHRRLPAAGRFRPVRLRAPFFGLRADVIVAAEQQLIVSGIDVAYMFGHEAVRITAGDVTGTRAAHFEDLGQTVDYCGLLLPRASTLDLSGAAFAGLNIGRLRRRRAQLDHTLFAAHPADCLPEHGAPAGPAITPFEAVTLIDTRAA